MNRFSTRVFEQLQAVVDISSREYSAGVRYVSAVGWVGMATLLQLPLGPLMAGANPFMFFFVAVLFSAWFGGFGPGLLATALGALAGAWLWSWPLPGWHNLPRHVWLHSTLFSAVGGAVSVFAEALHRAVAARGAAERVVRDEREQLRVTLASIGDGVIATNEEGRVRFMNAVAERLSGWSAWEARGRPLEEVFQTLNEKTRAPVPNPVKRVLSSGMVVGLAEHTVLVSRSGEEHPIEDSAAPIRDERGTVRGVVLVFHDVTVRRRAEQRLVQQAEELEQRAETRTAELREKVAELEAFSYSVSHDLRTPLRAIQGYCGLLLDELKGRIDRETYGYLERVDVATRRLDRLVVDVLTFSSIARGPLRLERVELENFLPQVIELYPLWREPVATVELCRPLLPVLAYEAFLTQCVTNLISNAVKFIAPGDKPRITVRTERQGRMVRLWVEDNGIGVAERDRERIFRMFERGTTDQRFSGTGIGLAVVRKAAQRMGGYAGVDPRPGGGSRFWIDLPAADA